MPKASAVGNAPIRSIQQFERQFFPKSTAEREATVESDPKTQGSKRATEAIDLVREELSETGKPNRRK